MVHATSRTQTTVSATTNEMVRTAGTSTIVSAPSAIITTRPDIAMVWPAVPIATPVARSMPGRSARLRTDPLASSSRKRLTMNNE